jgi:hypothetical protein
MAREKENDLLHHLSVTSPPPQYDVVIEELR